MTRATIDTVAILKMVYSSLAASIAVAIVFATAILGAVRSVDMRRAQRGTAAAAYAALATIGVLFATAIVVYGLVLIAHK